MDGVYVAYHNTARIFGFQYVPVEEMDERLFGGTGGYDALSRNTTGKVGSLGVGRVDEIMGKRAKGDRIFERCVRLMEVICQEVISCYPGMVCRKRKPFSSIPLPTNTFPPLPPIIPHTYTDCHLHCRNARE